MKDSRPHGLPTAIADTRSLMQELENLGKRLKPAEERKDGSTRSEMVLKGK